MNFQKIVKKLLFPHITIMLLLLPFSSTLLVYSMLVLSETSPVRIASYVIAFYTLTVFCLKIPKSVTFFKHLKNNNKYIRIWLSNPRLRMNITLIINVIWNGAYAVLQLGTGIYHHSVWFYSLSLYYTSLTVMRFFLVHHTLHNKSGENIRKEFKYYKICGWIFLIMNLSLSGMMFYMINQGKVTHHSEITTIAMAVYTFTALTVAIINVIKYKKYNSPAMSAAKAVSLATSCVSILTLENTMLTTFGTDNMTLHTKKLFLSLSGGAISLLIIITAVYMIRRYSQTEKQSTEKV